MDPGNAFARKPKARHRVFGSKSLLSDHLWSGAEAQNYVTPAENISSRNLSDETTASKEGISTRSSSWPEDYHTCFDTPCRKYLHENIVQTLSPTHGNVNDRPFESSQQYPEALEYQLARLTLQYRDLSESYTDSNIRLRQAYAEIDDLTKHNLQLQASFTEFPQSVGITRPNQALHNLPMHMSSDPYSIIPRQPSVSSIHNPLLSFTPHQLVAAPSSLQSLNFPANNSNGSAKYGHVQRESITDDVNILEKNITTDAAAETSPTRNRSLEFNNKAAHYHPKSNPASSSLERAAVEMPSCQRPALPKSISIRSPGFLTAKKGVKKEKPSPANSPGQPHRLRLAAPAPPDIAPVSAPVDGDVEYEVYNQGMLKTELCDKWQDTGTCPYGAGCQFAHGMQELRPVIRHPRFKMELCRMVAAGIKCLYGHRCHFRHALSDEEKEFRNCK